MWQKRNNGFCRLTKGFLLSAALFFLLITGLTAEVVSDTARLGKALREAQELHSGAPENVRTAMHKAALKAAGLKATNLEAQAYHILGSIAFNQGQYDSARFYHQKALILRQQANLVNEADESVMNLALVESGKGNFDKALELLLGALEHQEKEGTPRVKALLLNELGKLHDQLGQFPKAKEFLENARHIFEKLKDEKNLAINAAHLGNLYTAQGDVVLAEHFYLNALAYFEKHQDLKRMASCYSNLANIYLQGKQTKKGLSLYSKALAVHEKLGNISGQISTLNNLALYYETTLQQPVKALPYYEKAYRLAKETGNMESERDIAGNLFLLYKSIGDNGNALAYLERYADLQDSLVNETGIREIAKLQEKYKADERAGQIAKLQSDNLVKEMKASRRTWERNVSIAAGVFLLALALLLIRHFRQKQRSAQLLAQKTHELNQKRMQELLQKQEVATLHAHLEGQEVERKRIAQDLHDRLGGLLATVKLYFQVARTPEQMEKTSDLLDVACQEVRQIAHDMASGDLMKFGLVLALRGLAESITSSGQLRMTTHFLGLGARLDTNVEVTLYRIVQELVSNTLRHAHATEITLQLIRRKDSLRLLMEDNGRGFKAEKITPGMGLESVRCRVEKLQGVLTIDSGQGSGTTIIIDVPLLHYKIKPVSTYSMLPEYDTPSHS